MPGKSEEQEIPEIRSGEVIADFEAMEAQRPAPGPPEGDPEPGNERPGDGTPSEGPVNQAFEERAMEYTESMDVSIEAQEAGEAEDN